MKNNEYVKCYSKKQEWGKLFKPEGIVIHSTGRNQKFLREYIQPDKNKSNYKELFDKDNNTITWYSDETNHDFANILKIKKEEDSFKLEFYLQPHVDGFDEDFTIPIRFCNSGSQYDPFNVIFMRMYNKMVNIDFNNDYEDQVSIKEYLESEKKVKKKTK